jgi:hypothetical protein
MVTVHAPTNAAILEMFIRFIVRILPDGAVPGL